MEEHVSLLSFNGTDYVIVGIILLSVVIGLIRGFIKEVFSLVAWGLAAFCAVYFCTDVAHLFVNKISTPATRIILAFALIFLGTLIAGSIVSYCLSQMVQKTGLSGMDRLLGTLFGMARGVIIVAVFVLLADFTNLSGHHAWQTSVLVPKFQIFAKDLRNYAPQVSGWFKDSKSVHRKNDMRERSSAMNELAALAHKAEVRDNMRDADALISSAP